MPQTKEEKNAKLRAARATQTPEEKAKTAATTKAYNETHKEELVEKRRAQLLEKNPDARKNVTGVAAERFEHYIDADVTVPVDLTRAVPGCPEEPCLTGWTASRNQDGYPQMKVNGTMVKVHRWLYEQEHGPIPKGMEIRHLCNNGHLGCLQIHHLQAGTMTENQADRIAAGTTRRSLSADQVRGIKVMVKIGYTDYQQLADWYRTTKGTIGRIVRGETYKEVQVNL